MYSLAVVFPQQRDPKYNAAHECKPDSVNFRSATIHLSSRYPELQPRLTAQQRHGPRLVPYLALHRKGFSLHLASQPNTVVSCTTLSPLPIAGRSISVALSLPQVCPAAPSLSTGQSALWCPDFPPHCWSGRPSCTANNNLIPQPNFAIGQHAIYDSYYIIVASNCP